MDKLQDISLLEQKDFLLNGQVEEYIGVVVIRQYHSGNKKLYVHVHCIHIQRWRLSPRTPVPSGAACVVLQTIFQNDPNDKGSKSLIFSTL
jgi:hypothetical protein